MSEKTHSALIKSLDQQAITAGFAFAEAEMAAYGTQEDPYLPEQNYLDQLHKSMRNLIVVCDARAEFSHDTTVEQELRWVPVARTILRRCAHLKPEMPRLDNSRIFSNKDEDLQRRLYRRSVAANQTN